MSTDQKPSRMRLQVASLPEIAANAANDAEPDGASAVAVVSKDTSMAPATPVPSLVVVLAIATVAGAGAGVAFGFLL